MVSESRQRQQCLARGPPPASVARCGTWQGSPRLCVRLWARQTSKGRKRSTPPAHWSATSDLTAGRLCRAAANAKGRPQSVRTRAMRSAVAALAVAALWAGASAQSAMMPKVVFSVALTGKARDAAQPDLNHVITSIASDGASRQRARAMLPARPLAARTRSSRLRPWSGGAASGDRAPLRRRAPSFDSCTRAPGLPNATSARRPERPVQCGGPLQSAAGLAPRGSVSP